MTTARLEPAGLALRLALARTLAWALLISGWLVLGTLGRQHLPLWADGQAAIALWLVTMAGGLAWAKDRRGSMATLRLALATAGGVGAAALLALPRSSGPAAAWLLIAAMAWGVALLGASFCVQALRRASTQRPPAPCSAALVGAALSWAVAGDLAAVSRSADLVALALLAATLVAAALAPHGAGTVSACRAGLFDCSLHLPRWRLWQDAAQWPRLAAGWVMLPMMAALSRMSEWCSVEDGMALTGPATVALHLGAMLLPAWGLNCAQRRTQITGSPPSAPPRLLPAGVASAMLTSGLVLLIWPGFAGLMAASLCQAVAWSLAWHQSMQQAPVSRPIAQPSAIKATSASSTARWQRIERGTPLAASAAAVITLGWATNAVGPAAFVTIHAMLAVLATAGAAWSWVWHRSLTAPTQAQATSRHPHPRNRHARPLARRVRRRTAASNTAASGATRVKRWRARVMPV